MTPTCHVCGAATGTARRHGRLHRIHAVDADAPVPATARVCPDCRDEVADLVRHWDPREPLAATCSFCADAAVETGLVELVDAVGDRVTARRTYLLCRDCEHVFGTFLSTIGDPPRSADTDAPTAEVAVEARGRADTEAGTEASDPT